MRRRSIDWSCGRGRFSTTNSYGNMRQKLATSGILRLLLLEDSGRQYIQIARRPSCGDAFDPLLQPRQWNDFFHLVGLDRREEPRLCPSTPEISANRLLLRLCKDLHNRKYAIFVGQEDGGIAWDASLRWSIPAKSTISNPLLISKQYAPLSQADISKAGSRTGFQRTLIRHAKRKVLRGERSAQILLPGQL